ncbi:hypothetical protein ACJMK2_006104 [Sinanodonta woodiana]|uniref:IRS-type PTB domain-containing protein n=1 Tax=Sinanodonta woodiana TaxID=1069815 RepID=A0ABD3VSV0_SINWO
MQILKTKLYENDKKPTSRFKIKIDENDAASRCHLKGHYSIHISSTCISLQDSRYNVVYSWPYVYIRRYGVENNKNVFVIEAGRRCDSGEGMFRFKTHKAQEINDLIQEHLTRLQTSYNPVVIAGPSKQAAKQKDSGVSAESDKRPQLPNVNQSTAYSSSRDGTPHNSQGVTKAKKPPPKIHSKQMKLGKSGGPSAYPDAKKEEEESDNTEIDQDDVYESV